jgi:hypothetical protein
MLHTQSHVCIHSHTAHTRTHTHTHTHRGGVARDRLPAVALPSSSLGRTPAHTHDPPTHTRAHTPTHQPPIRNNRRRLQCGCLVSPLGSLPSICGLGRRCLRFLSRASRGPTWWAVVSTRGELRCCCCHCCCFCCCCCCCCCCHCNRVACQPESNTRWDYAQRASLCFLL